MKHPRCSNSHNTNTQSANRLISRPLVSTLDWGHHQAMIQECEHIQ